MGTIMNNNTTHHNCSHTKVSHSFIENKNISNCAKAVYIYIISRHNGWKFCVNDIRNHVKSGRDSIRNAVNELIDLGYLTRKQYRNTDGTFAQISYEVIK